MPNILFINVLESGTGGEGVGCKKGLEHPEMDIHYSPLLWSMCMS